MNVFFPLLNSGLLAILFLRSVNAHGLVCTPRQRGAYRAADKCGSSLQIPENPVIDYCPHCLNGGTVASTSANLPPIGWKAYNPLHASFTANSLRAGLCGDPKGNDDHMLGGSFMPYAEVPIVETYKVGDVLDVSVEIDTNHNGFFEFFLCDIDNCSDHDISQRCFREQKCYRLLRVAHPSCQNPTKATYTECGPIDENHPGRFYVPCRNGSHVGVHVVGGPKGTMRYKLPDDVSCRHCVLQWYWATANSCAAPGFVAYFEKYGKPFGSTCPGDGGSVGGYRKDIVTCGGDRVPEEFWSCADVSILREGGRKSGDRPRADGTVTPPFHPTRTPSARPSRAPSPHTTRTSSPEVSHTASLDPTRTPPPHSIRTPNPSSSPSLNAYPYPSTDPAGTCVAEYHRCDGMRPCCEDSNVCVFRSSGCKFSCMKWWTLWNKGGERSSCKNSASEMRLTVK